MARIIDLYCQILKCIMAICLVVMVVLVFGNVVLRVIATELEAKRLGLLRELIPAAKTAAVLLNPQNPNAETQSKDVQQAGRAVGWEIQILNASTERDLETAFAALVQRRTDALVVSGDTFFASQRNALVALAARHAIPAIYQRREYAEAGGLITYGTDFSDMFRQTGSLRRSDPQGREAGRSAGRAADQVRASDQPQDRQGARPPTCRQAARARRRGDRMMAARVHHAARWRGGGVAACGARSSRRCR